MIRFLLFQLTDEKITETINIPDHEVAVKILLDKLYNIRYY